MVDGEANSIGVEERFEELKRAIRPAGLRPGVGGGLSLLLASVGSYVWTAVRFESADDTAMTIVSSTALSIGDEVVLRCTGVEVGDVAFRMRVDAAISVDDEGGYRLQLTPIALSKMYSEGDPQST